jgi:hypothetical protein
VRENPDWTSITSVGVLFTFFGCAKFYGLAKGIIGGAEKPFLQRLFGT